MNLGRTLTDQVWPKTQKWHISDNQYIYFFKSRTTFHFWPRTVNLFHFSYKKEKNFMIKCVFLEGKAKKEEIIRHVLGIYEAKYRCVVLKVGGVDQATANIFSNPGPHFIFYPRTINPHCSCYYSVQLHVPHFSIIYEGRRRKDRPSLGLFPSTGINT